MMMHFYESVEIKNAYLAGSHCMPLLSGLVEYAMDSEKVVPSFAG